MHHFAWIEEEKSVAIKAARTDYSRGFYLSYDGYELKVPIPNIESFIDGGHQSHAFYNLPTSPTNLKEKLSNPDLLLLPKVIKAHLENHFPFLVIAHVENWLGKVAQVHLFVPESKTQT